MDPEQQLNPDPNQPQAMPPVQGGGGSSWIGWVVGIILVILVGGGVFYYYQYVKMPTMQKQIDDLNTQIQTLQKEKEEASTPADETADWKTFKYTNSSFGAVIKYPSDYTIKGGKENADGGVVFLKSGKAVVDFFPLENSENAVVSAQMNDMTGATKSTVTITGATGTKIEGTFGKNYSGIEVNHSGEKGTAIIFTKNSRVFQFNSYDNGDQTLKDNFDLMVENFSWE